ncbi:MAG: ADP-ribosylglycohydrolase family protein [Puniceicoccaceae bacterium]|nr:MAG: ADP-ribosylglycohydrolase family protein [Puniceicoccaceae bacterium]
MKQPLPPDYAERVYAGVLGKLIGVYLGRPFEQWSHEAIARRWGEIRRYVHEDQNVPLIVTDDDITGTFTFIRALLDHDSGAQITAREIGQSWLNYIAENKHILWWGGMGMSTEHTAWLRLAAGIPAPESGSIALNGKAVAEEIGAQIFIDGWALVSPNQPEQAARLATEAARVSHDGEAVHGAVALAVMEALAFAEPDIESLLDRSQTFIPADCEIAAMTADLRRWHREDGDWRRTLGRIQEHYSYERYGTNCPMVSNHAVILLGLLYGGGEFDRSMMIVNTAGYDTDCNSGNLGCLLGIRNGLATFRSGYDWRTPVNDRLYLPAGDGHWGMMDAANLALHLANLGRSLAGAEPERPKGGVRYSFLFHGCTHGFAPSELCPRETRVAPVPGGLELTVLAHGLRSDAEVGTFLPPSELEGRGYGVTATPTLYAGQQVTATIAAAAGNTAPVGVRLYVRHYGGGAEGIGLVETEGPEETIAPAQSRDLVWTVPDSGGAPIAKVGLGLTGPTGATVRLDRLDWSGTPRLVITRPQSIHPRWGSPDPWLKSFIADVDNFMSWRDSSLMLMRNRGRGLVHTGGENWGDLTVRATITPVVALEFGLAAHVRGLRRYHALLLSSDGRARLVRVCHEEVELAAAPFAWNFNEPVELGLTVRGEALVARINGAVVLEAKDASGLLSRGGVGLIVAEGRIHAPDLCVEAPA